MTLDTYIGPAAGLTTSVLWTGTSLLFTAAARRLGTTVLNLYRIGLAVVLLGVTHRLLTGQWIPELVGGQVAFLALSGVIGLSIGDQALFTSFVYLGPRLAMLIMATSPIFAAFFGWVVLGERLHGVAWLGVGLTVGGIAWVVSQRSDENVVVHGAHRTQGLILALIGAACQAGGLLLSKQGIGHGWLPPEQHLDAQAATLVRMFFAWLGMLPIAGLHYLRRSRRLARGIGPIRTGSRRAGFALASGGAVVGPFLGVWMSLVAADHTAIGVAQTLCSLTPVLILPFAVLIHKERIGPRAVVGAVLAVTGSALLFFKPA